MHIKHLCLIFGVTPTVCCRVINMMLKRVVRDLRSHPMARVQFPDEGKMRAFADQVQLREPSVDDIIGFMDGVGLRPLRPDHFMPQDGKSPQVLWAAEKKGRAKARPSPTGR